jgi:hypothetical protein
LEKQNANLMACVQQNNREVVARAPSLFRSAFMLPRLDHPCRYQASILVISITVVAFGIMIEINGF